MNWDAVVAVSEVIGVVAVIASIIYLAIQVKQSTDLARAGMVHDTSASWASYHAMIAADAGLADIYVRAVKGEVLTSAETLRYFSSINALPN